MSHCVLNDDDLRDLHEAALQETRARIRAALDEMLDEAGISDPARREQFHNRAMQRAMPMVRAVCLEDVEAFKRGDAPAVQH